MNQLIYMTPEKDSPIDRATEILLKRLNTCEPSDTLHIVLSLKELLVPYNELETFSDLDE